MVVLAVVGGALAVVLASGDDEAAASEVVREPVSSSGANPFMQSVGTDEPDVTPPPDTGGTFEGSTPGLYGGTMNQGSCDAEQMIAFLEANPDKAAAWADVLGIEVSEIRSYVATLTPVVLRSDVYVTNHGFANGRATTVPAVLQAGTAAFVDQYGFPVVKCYCGNPLTRPPPRCAGRHLPRSDMARLQPDQHHDRPADDGRDQHLHARRPADQRALRAARGHRRRR